MNPLRGRLAVALIGLAVAAIGCTVLVRSELASLRAAFETDARIVHRLLSQRSAQQDAVMSMLSLLQSGSGTDAAGRRVASVYPQILDLLQRHGDASWTEPALAAAEDESRRERRAALAGVDFARGRYWLVQAAPPASHAAQIDLRGMVPWEEWPMPPETSPVRVILEYAGQQFLLQAGNTGSHSGFDFRKRLATESQPFDVVAARGIRWSDLPWLKMLGWILLTAAALAGLLALERQRAERRRAEELLRLGQVARLNALGELAAGMAHELNQPLTAVLANTQAAGRMLNDEPAELDSAREAMQRAAEQARRASGVVDRLRRVVERPDVSAQLQPVKLEVAINNALYLLEPQLQQLGIKPSLGQTAVSVLAEPVALEQIIHNLLTNALQALAQVPAADRHLDIGVRIVDDKGRLTVGDSGPGIAADVLPRLFEPFFTTREGGLGLGLSLCESLAAGMGGSLTAANRPPRGAVFTLQLPLAAT